MSPRIEVHPRHALRAVLSVLFLFTYIGVTSAAPEVSEETLAKRRQTIQQLNESQRQELVRKYTSYRELDEVERNHLRTLHKDIEANAELKDVMQKYVEWLKNLDVTQREQLRQAKTPEQKRNLVERFRKEQTERKNELWREGVRPGASESRLMPPMTSDDLKSVMTAIETAYSKSGVISKERQAELEKWNGSQRYKILAASLGEYRQPKEGPSRHLDFPEEVVTALVNTIPNQEFGNKLRGSVRNPEQHPMAQKIVFMGLCRSTIEQAMREFNGPEKTELKDSLFQSLPPEIQARASQLPPGQLDMELEKFHRDEIWRAFSKAGDFPPGPGDRVQPGRAYPPFGPKRELQREGGPRDGGPRDGFRQPPPPDGRRPLRDRPKEGDDKRG